MPENITEIGASAFSRCEAIESITIPEGVKKIGEYCFLGTKSLSEIIIPKSVKMIDSCAFFEWTDKQTIKFRATEAGENWDKHWNCTYSIGVGTNIIWGYQDDNT